MKKELEHLGEPPVKSVPLLNYTVKLFQVVSCYQDILDGAIKVAPFSKEESAHNFNHFLSIAGRHSSEEFHETDNPSIGKVRYWNISKKGETITGDNIILGAEIGLISCPVSHWLRISPKQKITVNTYLSSTLQKKTGSSSMWITEAVVKYCKVYEFCKEIRENLIN